MQAAGLWLSILHPYASNFVALLACYVLWGLHAFLMVDATNVEYKYSGYLALAARCFSSSRVSGNCVNSMVSVGTKALLHTSKKLNVTY